MKVVVQRVKEASVAVGGNTISSIGKGVLLLAGIGKGDTPGTAKDLAQKILKLRIFEDDAGKMNLDLGGGVLVVSQFTLMADTSKGNRPGFGPSAPPDQAKILLKIFNDELKISGADIAEGEFGSYMEVSLINDGPVTFVLEQ